MRIVVLTILGMTLLSCEKNEIKKVSYSVSCKNCTATYANESGGTEQQIFKGGGGHYFNGKEGQFVYLSAQNNDTSGTIKVFITIDGEAFKSASSTGAYVIATASGSIPD